MNRSLKAHFIPKVSVIIPVYNVEPYLPRCLDSVINQTLCDIEIICINDCSTDGSLTVLKDYALKDKRIKLIDLGVNTGVSNARNIGLKDAKGEYIAFLDPDDWWELNILEKTFDKLSKENADIILFGHNCFENGKLTQDKIINKIKVANSDNYIEYFNDIVNYVWDKIYKTEFIKNNMIIFPLNIRLSEDTIFVLNCFSKNPNIIFWGESLYNYNKERSDSALQQHDKYVSSTIEAFECMLDSDFYKQADDTYKNLCIKKMIGAVIYFCIKSITKKYSVKQFLPNLEEFVLRAKSDIPSEFLADNKEFKALENIVVMHNRQKRDT